MEPINSKLEHSTIIKRTILFGILLSPISLFFEEPITFIYGWIFGLLFSILNFRLLFLTFKKAMQLSPNKAQSYVTSRYFLRYLITGMVLYISITRPYINILGTIAGMLLLKGIIFISNVINNKELNISAISKNKKL